MWARFQVFTKAFLVVQPRKSLFFEENQPRCPESNAQRSYKPFTMDEMKHALPEHRGSAPRRVRTFFTRILGWDGQSPKVRPFTMLVHLSTTHVKKIASNCRGKQRKYIFSILADAIKRDRFGQRDYSDANGPLTVVWNNCQIEDNFMPKNLHQHSVMSESYPNVSPLLSTLTL